MAPENGNLFSPYLLTTFSLLGPFPSQRVLSAFETRDGKGCVPTLSPLCFGVPETAGVCSRFEGIQSCKKFHSQHSAQTHTCPRPFSHPQAHTRLQQLAWLCLGLPMHTCAWVGTGLCDGPVWAFWPQLLLASCEFLARNFFVLVFILLTMYTEATYPDPAAPAVHLQRAVSGVSIPVVDRWEVSTLPHAGGTPGVHSCTVNRPPPLHYHARDNISVCDNRGCVILF